MLTPNPDITELPSGDLFSVPGLRGAAVATGVKPSGNLDLALIVADREMAAAGMFTTSAVAAPPVTLSRECLKRTGRARSIVVNSGNANALTGPRGMSDAEAMVGAVEARCGGPALVLSTGIIGVPLPLDKVMRGIDEAAGELRAAPGDAVATAILTTDTFAKTAAVTVTDPATKATYTVGGVAKGSGMIHPNMATMLAVIATDAPVAPEALSGMLSTAVDHSFHCISVDGDTSTSDAVILLAQMPAPGAAALTDAAREALQGAITQVAQKLAEHIIRDGEGMTRLMRIDVEEAASRAEAAKVAESVARSSLVKTALAGGDPNWGRILAAAGNAGIPVRAEDLSLSLGEHLVFERGSPVHVEPTLLANTFASEQVSICLRLGRGVEKAHMLTTDLTKRYVEINSEYTT